jgi:basic amino acid/polyamine antiporter, APA family
MANLLATKPLNLLMEESRENGRAQPEAHAGRFSAHRAGRGRDHRRGHFCDGGAGRALRRPGLMLSFVLSGMGCAFAGLCYAEFAAMIPLAGSAYTYAYATLGELLAWIIGWDLTLEYAMGASTVSSGWSNHFIELLKIFIIKMPLWLAYDHWTALKTAENIVARQMAQASILSGSRHAGVPRQSQRDHQRAVSRVVAAGARSAGRAASFRHGNRLQPAGLHHRPGHHRDSGVGIKESARSTPGSW